jgi:uncharacterized Zn-finger protein
MERYAEAKLVCKNLALLACQGVRAVDCEQRLSLLRVISDAWTEDTEVQLAVARPADDSGFQEDVEPAIEGQMEVVLDESENQNDLENPDVSGESSNHQDDVANILGLRSATTPIRIYVCHLCSCEFSQPGPAKRHLRNHAAEKPYACNECDMKFADASVLRLHVRSHTGERPHLCNQCGKCFAQPCYLRSHMRIHTGERPYSCGVCNRRFMEASSVRKHMMLHVESGRHVCSQCGKQFSKALYLEKHQKRQSCLGRIVDCLEDQQPTRNHDVFDSLPLADDDKLEDNHIV